jgi:hypothetical protein
MPKITVVTYVHAAHRKWIPFWISQLENQIFRDFKILFVAHNWKLDPLEYNTWLSPLSDDLWDNFASLEHTGPPVIGDVINFALKHVDTEYFAHWDVDDWINPWRLELQSAYLDAHPELDFLGTRMVGFTGEPTAAMTLPDYYEPNEPNAGATEHAEIYHCLLRKGQNCLGHTTMIYKVQAMKDLGGFSMSDVKLDGKSPDFETWKKALMAGYKFHRLPQLCALWRLDSSSIRL